ncbi:hypothetical protein BDV96DRAFT_506219 [Lophiotrema nucula]|uniref:Rhodopsin domain-containing protein n=1 Tax=Lophiotrema nucula TaxID=690887 RepID=A0A6A5YJE4_9PLEO|nr:hypothetical protein BDV96DRAFT_506219 [Lophiotrema nucula]
MAEEHVHNRKAEVIATCVSLTALCTFFAVWRIVVRFRINWKLGWSDYWMILAALLNIVDTVFNVLCAYAGQGRYLRDPFYKNMSKADKRTLLHYMFVNQSTNLYIMGVVRLSICAYLMALNFSKSFRVVIWATTFVVVVCGFILPSINVFGWCVPMSMRWDPRVKGHCHSVKFRTSIAYTNAAANIATDVVFAAAPIIYLRSVKLSRRTQWGVRAVFLLCLAGTVTSCFKFAYLDLLAGHAEFNYESVTLTIWSHAEVTVGMVTANLPPLRNTFDKLFKSLLPDSIGSRFMSGYGSNHQRSRNMELETYGTLSKKSRGRRKDHAETMDDESERRILPDGGGVEVGVGADADGKGAMDTKFGGIARTTTVTVQRSEQTLSSSEEDEERERRQTRFG